MVRTTFQTKILALSCAALCVVLLLPSFSFADAKENTAASPEKLTLDWIHSPEARSASPFPSYTWIDDHRALFLDRRLPEEEQKLQILDAATGELSPFVDEAKALAGVNEMLQPEKPHEELGWPREISSDGGSALYSFDGDLFRLDLASSTFHRLTEGGVHTNIRFSPDGGKLAFTRDNDLWVIDESGESRRLTQDGTDTLLNGTLSWVYWEELFGRDDRGYWWSPDGKHIAFLQSDESLVPQMTYVDFKPDHPRVIKQRYPKAGAVNPRVRVGVVEIESGETTWVDLGTYPHEYIARVVWRPEGDSLVVQTLDRPQTHLDLFEADVADGAARHLLRESMEETWIDVHDDLHFLDDGRFLWLSDRDGYAHLYLYDADGKLMHRVTEGEWTITPSNRRGTGVSAIDEEAGRVWFTALEKSSIERHLYSVGLDGSGLKRLTREDGSHRVTWSTEGTYYFDDFSNIDTPRSLALHQADGKRLKVLAEPDRSLAERFGLRSAELFTVPAEDGFQMPAYFLKPADFDPKKKYPVIVRVYGGPAAPTVRNRWSARLGDHVLTDEGFVIFGVDNRTATAMGKKYTGLLVRDLYHQQELGDLLDAVAWLKKQSFVDPARVGITGWSGGGTFTLLAMTSSEEFRAGVAGAPVSDWRYYDTIYTERYMKRPQDNQEGYEATSNVLRAKDLNGRLLLIHGTYDDNVNPQNSWAFAHQLQENGILFDFMIYPMHKHGIRGAARKHLSMTMLDFWKRHLRDGEEGD